MKYYLWVDGEPSYWWIARGDSPKYIKGMWFKDLSEWVDRYPNKPERTPGEYMRPEQVVKITKDEAYRVILSPNAETIKPLFKKYGADLSSVDWTDLDQADL